jgi:NAD(P)-dependent dehydrogenase (short-subunit alcohol dehydrogenase family)
MAERTALVTGANRGLGFETARQLGAQGYLVLAGARTMAKAEDAAARLRAEGSAAEPVELDVRDAAQAEALRGRTIDVLVNNAGIVPEGDLGSHSAFDVPPEVVLGGFENNALGAFRLIQLLAPGMRERGYGRIVNLSSGMGQLADMYGGHPGYRISKTALNAVTRIFAYELREANVLVNSVCPGFVRTDMGGQHARLSVEEGARGIVWAATLADGGPSGGFFRHGEPIPW